MGTQLFKLLFIGLNLFALQHVHAANIKSTTPAITLNSNKQPSPIEKALEQLKRDEGKMPSVTNDKLKVKAFTSSQKEPTQHFLAEQNQQFSRLLQSFFPSQGS
ncbi:hypothetical protein [Acinetobacter rudis]|uniref:DUF4179 domain-containing protein n=1 Tax=Acinetobacter rudis CIP 110305 TaxID=421052 RepID=S3NQB5_9GAMM|nr:hypothetical protein [Acinetobacter rudis]EPF80613.1 hypothetical protein F945_00356 [Acinetobacter rudis CIP 110305]